MSLREKLTQNLHIKSLGCTSNVCAGDVYIGENLLLSPTNSNEGVIDAVCTVMNTLDRAVCRWTLYFTTESELQVVGVSYPKPGNDSEIVILGGTKDYLGVLGSGTTYLSPQQDYRYFDLFLCFPDVSPRTYCRDGSISYREVEPLSDVVVPAIPGKWSIGVIDIFDNAISLSQNPFQIQKGSENGLCTFLQNRWTCQYNVLLPYENNKLFLQGSIHSAKDSPAVIPLIGGTGVFGGARGNATVVARQSSQNAYYWEISASFKYGCIPFSGTTRVSFRQTVGNSKVIPSKKGNGKSPTVGDVRVFIDDLYFADRREGESRLNAADGRVTGTCILLSNLLEHYCEWIIQYPLHSTANGRGSSQIVVVGTVADNPKTFSTIGIVGGTGLWTGAMGWGTYQTYTASPNDSLPGSNVASFEIEFAYIAG